MSAENFETHVTPQDDGALFVHSPDEQTRYDMGNRQLFVTFDGRGSVPRILLTEGYYVGAWHLQYQLDASPFVFSQARAIGRLWELRGAASGIEIELDSFLEETTAAVFQSCTINNHSSECRTVELSLTLDIHAPFAAQQQQESAEAVAQAQQPGSAHSWSTGLAKVALPASPGYLQIQSGGQIEFVGAIPFMWGATEPPRVVESDSMTVRLQWQLRLERDAKAQVAWALCAGSQKDVDDALARRALAHEQATAYAGWLSSRLHTGDPLLQSLFVAGLNCAVAMFKEFPKGRAGMPWAGLVAGPDYAYPPRLYFRDSYWTAQVLLNFRPDLVRRHLLSLARGVHVSGECPSGIFLPHSLHWQTPREGWLDWLPDHYDSPSFFVLLLSDYVHATQEWSLLDETILDFEYNGSSPAATLWEIAQRALQYLMNRERDSLLEKPYAANDWSDNVFRSVWVTYDQALYAAALFTASELAAHRGETERSAQYQRRGESAREAMNTHMWDAAKGHYINYKRAGFVEDHFSIDTLVVLRYGLADEARAARLLSKARQLQTRVNDVAGMGDWGVTSVLPLYKNAQDLFGKSAEPYHYHNGAEWAYWDGVYAQILMQRNDPDWRYVLTRWWEYGLAHRWLTPVEYYSPRYPHGGMLQGWSAMPAAALVADTIAERTHGHVATGPSL